MKYEQFLDIYNAGPEATYKLLLSLMETNLRLQAQGAQLEKRVKELEDRLNKNSQNSSKPPSTDEFIKPKSQRKKSGKKPGGQKGHRGNTLEMSGAPDVKVSHRVKNCQACGHSLEKVPPRKVEKRQDYDIPQPQVTITEHQGEHKDCPVCGFENRADFPAGVELPVQYGHNLKALLVYLNQYQLLPYKRTVELIEDIYGHRLSEGTLFNANQVAYEALAPVYLKKKGLISKFHARKIVHLFAGLIVLIVPFFILPLHAVFIALSLAVVVYFSSKDSSVKQLQELYESIGEEAEEKIGRLQGPFCYSISITVLIAIFVVFAPDRLYFPICGILIMIVSDTFASVIGKKYGRIKLALSYTGSERTLEGSLTFLVSAFILCFLAFYFFGLVVPVNQQALTINLILIRTQKGRIPYYSNTKRGQARAEKFASRRTG